MNLKRLEILFDIYINAGEDEEDIRSAFLSRGEDPDEIINRAKEFVSKKEAQLKLQSGKIKQSRASEFLKSTGESKPGTAKSNSGLGDIGFAYRKNESGGNNKDDLKSQAEKLNKLKKFMDNGNEHSV